MDKLDKQFKIHDFGNHARFREVKIGALFQSVVTGNTYRKVGKEHARRVNVNFRAQDSLMPWLAAEHVRVNADDIKWSKPASEKQQAARRRWQESGRLYRLRVNLLQFTKEYQSSLNLVQQKDVTRMQSLVTMQINQLRKDSK